MNIKWLLLAEGVPEYGAYEQALELAETLFEYEGTPADTSNLAVDLIYLPLGVVSVVRGRRVIKVDFENRT